MVAVRVPKPLFQPNLPVQVPFNRPPLRIVPPPPKTPPTLPGTGFGRLFGGIGWSISILWTSKAAYDAVTAVPSQLPWMPGPSVAPEIWTDPKRAMEEAHARFGHIDTPQLNQLLFIREKQALSARRDAMRNPHDRSLMVQDENGNWVQVPLNGQETGALVIGDLWKNGFPRKPTHQRASDEVRLIELELGRRDYQDTPKTDADKTWFEQYAEYIRDLAEALRKRANGENVPLPMFVFDTAEEPQMSQSRPQIMNSAASTASPPSSEPSSSASDQSDQTTADPIDFRSDTVTRPSKAMRDAIAVAQVGDDSYGEDPTVKRLERQTAGLLGTEDALFFPTCTMANQTAVRVLTKRGDEAVSVKDSHIMKNEADSVAVISGIHISPLGSDGLFTPTDLALHLAQQQRGTPSPTLMILENTHTASGGRIFPLTQFQTVTDAAREQGLRTHLDGARLFNAAVATGEPASAWGKSVDTVSVCFSKGLGAPAGAALCGTSKLIEEARKVRKILGGSMRQAGVLAAGALYAINHNIARLQEDHDKAKLFALQLEEMGIKVLRSPETNIILLTIPSAQKLVAIAKTYGVLLRATNDNTIRVVMHLDASHSQLQDALERMRKAYQQFLSNQPGGR